MGRRSSRQSLTLRDQAGFRRDSAGEPSRRLMPIKDSARHDLSGAPEFAWADQAATSSKRVWHVSSPPRSSSTRSSDFSARRTSSSPIHSHPPAFRMWSGCVDRGELRRARTRPRRPEVSAHVKGGLRRGVPQPRLHDLHVEAGGNQQRRKVVPKVVELGRETLDLDVPSLAGSR